MKYAGPANFLLHFRHSQIPAASRFKLGLAQKGQTCFCFWKTSTALSLFLMLEPALAPNLPADFTFFVLVMLLVIHIEGF